MLPLTSERNFTPSSTALVSAPLSTVPGTAVLGQMVSGAACRVSVVLPDTLPCVALMVVLPAATPVAKPAALTVATALLEEPQLTRLVMFCVLVSE